MGKKNDSKNEKRDLKKAAGKVAKALKTAAKEKEGAKAEKKPVAPMASPAPKTTPARPGPRKSKSTAIPLSEIQLRAYFVAEKRQREGRPGDADSDWLEAERQIRLERSARGGKPASPAKPRATKATPRKKAGNSAAPGNLS